MAASNAGKLSATHPPRASGASGSGGGGRGGGGGGCSGSAFCLHTDGVCVLCVLPGTRFHSWQSASAIFSFHMFSHAFALKCFFSLPAAVSGLHTTSSGCFGWHW